MLKFFFKSLVCQVLLLHYEQGEPVPAAQPPLRHSPDLALRYDRQGTCSKVQEYRFLRGNHTDTALDLL